MKPRFQILHLLLCLILMLLSACVYTSKLPPLALKEDPGKTVLIRNVSIFSGSATAPVLTNADILIDHGVIAEIGTITAPKDCRIIDGTGKMVIPGLIDHHIHISAPGSPHWLAVMPDERMYDRNLSAYLFSGVTTVFDFGGPSKEIEALDERMKAEDTVNPRIFYVGKVFNKEGGHPDYMLRALVPWPFDSMVIRDVMYGIREKDEVAPAIADNMAHGSRMTKIMVDQLPFGVPSLQEDLIAEIVTESRRHGLAVASHVGSESDIITGLNAGVRLFAHAPYRSSLSDSTIARMKETGSVIIPTLVVFEASADFFEQKLQFSEFEKSVLDPKFLDAYMNAPAGAFDYDDPRLEAWVHDLVVYRDIKFDNVRRMRAAGIPIIVGTDSPNVATVAGTSIHTELQMLVEKCGFTPVEALSAATGESGRMIEKVTGERGIGRIEKGSPADLVILDGDFREDISRTQNIYMIISNGRIVNRNPGK